MKILRSFGLSIFAITLCTSFNSCSNDDDFNEEEGTGTHKGHEYIDLGLASGTKWAICNVGASTPSEYGYYLAWGETKPKSTYNEETYLLYDPKTEDYSSNLGIEICGTKYDAATSNWGGKWRMPTKGELLDLKNNCTWKRTTLDGVWGYEVTGKNGNSIFLPAGGQYDNEYGEIGEEGLWKVGECFYWSGTGDSYQGEPYPYYAWALINDDEYDIENVEEGLLVRPVLK